MDVAHVPGGDLLPCRTRGTAIHAVRDPQHDGSQLPGVTECSH
jgi:hypothetical protein